MLEHQIKMGRDTLFDLLSYHGLLIRRSKRRVVTTHSFHWLRKYPILQILLNFQWLLRYAKH
jgi:putative transposase